MPRKVLSTEDGGLGVSTLVTTRLVQYLDIDLLFKNRPSGDIFKKADAAAVRQAVKNLVLTNHFEKPFDPFFGGDVRNMLFELADDQTATEVRSEIIEAIEAYEPRAKIVDVKVTLAPDHNDAKVTIIFNVINTEEEVVFTVTLSRLR